MNGYYCDKCENYFEPPYYCIHKYSPEAPVFNYGEKMTGKIKKIVTDKGFGFITSEKKDYFFHRSDLDGEVFEHLNEKQDVSFEPYKKEGKDRARAIKCV